jgi:hypothetical protein
MTVMIGIDPHKRSHTAVALDEHDTVLDELRIDADARQVARLLGWAAGWPERIWAIENANGLGLLLSRQLLAAGEQVRDVPASLSAQVRKLSGSGHKTQQGRREVQPREDGPGCIFRFEHGGWNETNAATREKFGDWPVMLDRFAALVGTRT